MQDSSEPQHGPSTAKDKKAAIQKYMKTHDLTSKEQICCRKGVKFITPIIRYITQGYGSIGIVNIRLGFPLWRTICL